MTFSKTTSIALLMLAATLFSGHHVAARFAYDDGAGLILALCARSGVAMLLMLSVAVWKQQSFKLSTANIKKQLMIGALIALQSWSLYSSIARIPVAISLLLVNTWPLLYIIASWLTGRSQARWSLGAILLAILIGLMMVLNPSTTSGIASHDWFLGIGLGLLSATAVTFAMWITNFYMTDVPGGVRSTYTMLIVFCLMLIAGLSFGAEQSFSLPSTAFGFTGLAVLALLYGIASTVLFVLAPRLDLANNSPALNFEPVAALLLSFLILGQALAAFQLVGVFIVVLGIVAMGILKE